MSEGCPASEWLFTVALDPTHRFVEARLGPVGRPRLRGRCGGSVQLAPWDRGRGREVRFAASAVGGEAPPRFKLSGDAPVKWRAAAGSSTSCPQMRLRKQRCWTRAVGGSATELLVSADVQPRCSPIVGTRGGWAMIGRSFLDHVRTDDRRTRHVRTVYF